MASLQAFSARVETHARAAHRGGRQDTPEWTLVRDHGDGIFSICLVSPSNETYVVFLNGTETDAMLKRKMREAVLWFELREAR